MRMYSSTASVTLPLKVEYTCCFCENVIVDEDQKMTLSASSHGSMNPSPKLNDEARARLARTAASAMQRIESGNFRPAYLTCTCSSCGKKQPWASYIKPKAWAFVLLALSILFVISFIVSWDSMSLELTPAMVIVPAAMAVPTIVIEVANFITGRKVAKLDKRYLPRISFKN